jgi:membrane protease YdiL (CAAX protease family)
MLSEKPWDVNRVGWLFLGLILTYCVGMLPIGLLDRVTAWSKDERDFSQLLAGALLSQVAAFFWIRFFLRQHAFGWREAFGWNFSEAASVTAYGALAGALFLPVAFGLQWLCEELLVLLHSHPQTQAAVEALQNPALPLGGKVAFGVDAVLLAPLVEESLFRGILYPAIKYLGYPRVALWFTSLLFAFLHFNEPTFVPLLAFGLLLAGLYERFGNLMAPIAAHGLFNAANLVILMIGGGK